MYLSMIQKMVKKHFLLIMACIFVHVTVLVVGQDRSGFMSLDCGIPKDYSYNDAKTGIYYESDAKYIETGTSMNLSSSYQNPGGLLQQFLTVRSFPEGRRNCYTLTPPTATTNNTYLIRASFLYGDYDGQNHLPEFDLHVGVNKWDAVSFFDISTVVTKEIIHNISSKTIDICLINTGSGTPFISSLELRFINSSVPIYRAMSGSLLLYKRLNFGSTTNEIVRYRDDIFDRIWEPQYSDDKTPLNNTRTIKANPYFLPQPVISIAVYPTNANDVLEFYWNFAGSSTFYLYMHFAELNLIQYLQGREFNIFVNGLLWLERFSPEYVTTTTVFDISPDSKQWLNISLSKSEHSTNPPIISAVEIYAVKELLQLQTNDDEARALMNIKLSYQVEKNWQGDPCAPKELAWNGVTCIYNNLTAPRVAQLDLSSSGLTGEIPSYISNLTLIQYLDLSNNSLTGKVPIFLSRLSFLTVIKLTKNNLTGPLPEELLEKIRKGLVTVSMDDNSNPCSSALCKGGNNDGNNNNNSNKNKNKIVAVAASVGALIIALIAVTTFWAYKRNRIKSMRMKLKGRLKDTTSRKFTYSEILSITNDLETVIGKGGFGPVYHGNLEGTEVAVKMLSASSIQGYKEFRTEVEFLTRVHHVNFTTLVGYCDEGDNIGLIYEYMSNGNLKERLSDRHPLLSWEERLRIAMDAATGLEYLHHRCKPPIIHRDVKSDNILLDQKFQAKLADFGLSKDFPDDHTHVSTALAGTPGYLDPEYYISYQLTEKSDIYSFGVVLLEIITGKPVLIRDPNNAHIIQRVSFMLNNEDITNIIDPRLGRDFEMNSLKIVLDVAMACASLTSALRPSMNRVVMELSHCLALERTRTNGNIVTEIKEESCKSDGAVTEIKVVSVNFDSENSLIGR